MTTVEEYAALFNSSGFDVHDAWIEREITRLRPKEALDLLQAIVGAALFNPACYENSATNIFLANLEAMARDIVLAGIERDGLVEGKVHRLYLLAIKPLLA